MLLAFDSLFPSRRIGFSLRLSLLSSLFLASLQATTDTVRTAQAAAAAAQLAAMQLLSMRPTASNMQTRTQRPQRRNTAAHPTAPHLCLPLLRLAAMDSSAVRADMAAAFLPWPARRIARRSAVRRMAATAGMEPAAAREDTRATTTVAIFAWVDARAATHAASRTWARLLRRCTEAHPLCMRAASVEA